ncbi:MAG: DUF4234 domain-containing protein, partial [Euryarchaeota archaeon]|nr:DUF4234 domain-containing protein [Euryarchaeota archaeon]
MAEGKKRSPGVDIVLFIVTLGVYWWFWTYKAFHEIAERERRPLPAAKFFPAMIVLWLIGLGVSGYGAAKTFQERLKEREAGTSPENPFAAQLDQFSDPIVIAGIVAS